MGSLNLLLMADTFIGDNNYRVTVKISWDNSYKSLTAVAETTHIILVYCYYCYYSVINIIYMICKNEAKYDKGQNVFLKEKQSQML